MKSKALIGFLAVVMIAAVGTLISVLNQSIDESPINNSTAETATTPTSHPSAADDNAPPSSPRRKDPATTAAWSLRGYGVVTGRVLEYGTEKPVGDHPLRLVAVGGPDRTIEGKTLADGTFALRNVPNFDRWTMLIDARAPFKNCEIGAVVVTAKHPTDLGAIYLSPNFAVRGSVVNDSGSGIGGVRVMAQRLSGGEFAMDMMKLVREIADDVKAIAVAETAADGSFVFTDLPPGNYDFLLSSDRYAVRSEKGWAITPDIEKHPLRFTMSRGFEIDGRVVRKDGGSPVGVRVVAVVNLDDEDSLIHPTKVMAITDDHGAFKLKGLPAGQAAIAAAFSDRPTVIAEDVRVPHKSFVEICVDGQAVLAGRVVDEESRPIAGADITALLAGRSGSVATTRTDAEGIYKLAGLPAAPMPMIFISADGFAPYPDDLMSMARRPAASADAPLLPGRNKRNFTLKRGSIVRGIVRSKLDGRPIDGARVVVASGTSTFTGNQSAMTDADGKFEIVGLGIGPAMLSVEKDGWCGRNPTDEMMMAMTFGSAPTEKSGDLIPGVVTVKKLGETIETSLELEPAPIISGRITDADGRGIAGARVDSRIIPGDENGDRAKRLPTAVGATARFVDSDGNFRINGRFAKDAKLVVLAEAPGFCSSASEPLEVGPGRNVEDIRILLHRGGTIEGRVIDESGRPIEGASVRRALDGERLDDSDWDRVGRGAGVTDEDGKFTMTTVEPGTWAVRAFSAGKKPAVKTAIAVTEGAAVAVTLTLEEGLSIAGTVVDESGRPVARANVRAAVARDEEVAQIGGQPGPSRPEDVMSTADGSFKFLGLSPMKLDLVATADGFAESERVRADAGADGIRIVVRRPQRISGKVIAAQSPVVGIAVTIENEDIQVGDRFRTVVTDAAGGFVVADLAPGSYTIRAETNAWRHEENDLNVVPGFLRNVAAGTEGVVLVLERGSIIEGTVRRSDGVSTDGAIVDVYSVVEKDRAADGDARPLIPIHRSTIVKGGRFSIRGLAPAEYRVVVEIDDYAKKQITAKAPASEVAIVLGGGCKITGRVVNEGGQGRTGAFVYLKSGEHTASRKCGDEGTFTLDGLEPGRWTLGAWAGALVGELPREIDIPASGTLDIGTIVVRPRERDPRDD